MDERRKLIRRYFLGYPTWTLWALILIVFTPGSAWLGLVGLAIVVGGIIYHFTGKPTDEQFDGWVGEEIAGLVQRALQKTGLDASELIADHVLITGPRLRNRGGAAFRWKRGKDGLARYSPINVTFIFFTKDQLVAYSCGLDMTTGNPVSESTDEYFYKDVVSVQTKSTTSTWASAEIPPQLRPAFSAIVSGGQVQLNDAETFVLTTAGGTALEVMLRHPELVKLTGDMPTTKADESIQVIRKMLRDKKSA